MSMTDPIADMLTRIRNGLKAEKISVDVPASKNKQAIAKVLIEEGYIADCVAKDINGKPGLEIALKYYAGQSVIAKIDRVSKPGRRVYRSAGDLPIVIGGLGVAIISTSQGIMTAKTAGEKGIGGEVICSVH